MPMNRITIPAALSASALFLAACGGGAEGEVRDVIKTADKDPQALCDNASKSLLDQIGGTEKCKEAARAYASEDSPIEGDIGVSVNGDKATATFKTADGKDHTVGLVKEDGAWKIDTPE